MRLQPIVYTRDMERAVSFYARLVGTDPDYRSEVWTSFSVGDAALGVHAVDALPDGTRVELSLIATEVLEDVVARLAARDLEPERGIRTESFGRSVLYVDPDGSPVQINEHRHG